MKQIIREYGNKDDFCLDANALDTNNDEELSGEIKNIKVIYDVEEWD